MDCHRELEAEHVLGYRDTMNDDALSDPYELEICPHCWGDDVSVPIHGWHGIPIDFGITQCNGSHDCNRPPDRIE